MTVRSYSNLGVLVPRSYTMSTKQGSYPVNTPDTFISAESFDSTYFISAQHAKPTRTPRKEKSRKFFQQVQPTFSLEQPTNTIELEFLDNFDPAKDIVVRRKAREWVNKNKGHRVQIRRVKPQPEETREDDKEERQNQLITVKSKDTIKTHDPLKIIGVSQKDPFGILPDIGRKYDHIIDFCELVWFYTCSTRYQIYYLLLDEFKSVRPPDRVVISLYIL